MRGHFEKTCLSTQKPSSRQTAAPPTKLTPVHEIPDFQTEICKTDSDSFDVFAAESGVLRKDVMVNDRLL